MSVVVVPVQEDGKRRRGRRRLRLNCPPPTSLSASALPRPLRAGLHQILILEHYGCVQLGPDHLIHLEVEQQNLGGRGQQATEFYAAAWTDTKVGRKRDEARKLTQSWLDFNHLPSSPVLT